MPYTLLFYFYEIPHISKSPLSPFTLPQIQTHVRSTVPVHQPFNYKFPEFNFTTNTKLSTHTATSPQLLKINRCWVELNLKYWRWLNSILEIFSPIKTNVKIVIRELQTSRYHKIKSVVSYLVMLGSLLLLIASKRSVKSFQITYLIGLEMNYSAQILMMSATKVEFFLVREQQQPVVLN